ncbi:integral membrane protein GPR155 [Nephila pilipes]|uniref:Integral membrane protein GPR155 n=1 Tax=Nephila pilipes TaxID=299642 RepID=A0A8X6NTD3_NEPPI|nr:integral membrane protein GPR155 [Nephila pilipes]
MFSQVTQIGAIYQLPPPIGSLQWCKFLPDDVNITNNASLAEDIDFDRLLPTLFECFAIVFCGFLAGRCNLISTTDIKGLNDFTTYFTLPPLIFLNLVTINFNYVNWLFVLSVLLSKIIVFFLVAIVTASVHRPTNLSYAGIYGIFCTQGNDFGLAYPIVASLYGSKRPLYPGYMYLIAPTSLLFLNPMGFILMEAQKNKDAVDYVSKKSVSVTIFRTIGNVSWNILRNPIVFVTLLGVFGNFLFHGGLPSVLFGILQILSSAFSAAVLFLLGFSVAGTGESRYSKKEGLLIPSVLLIAKMLVSPLITRSCVSMLCAGAPDMEDLADYGFLYGMVPTGPIVMLFAAEYGLRTEMMASTMVLCTGLFGPVVFVLARMLSLKVRGIGEFADELRTTMLVLSILSFLSCLWIGISFLMSKKLKQQIYKITGSLLISQVILALGIFTWSVCQSSEEWMMYLEIILISAGQLMTRMWVTILAVTMVCIRRHPKSQFIKNMFWPNFFGIGFPVIIVILILIFTGIGQCEPDLDKELPLFIYGTTEAVGSIVILVLCLSTTSFCLILYFRTPPRQHPITDTIAHGKKEVEGFKKDIQIDVEKGKGPTTNDTLVNGATIAIYKLMKPDSDTTEQDVNNFKQQMPHSSQESSPDNSPAKMQETMKRSETSFSEKHLLSTDSEVSSVESSPIHSKTVSSISSSSEKDEGSRVYLRHAILLILSSISMAVGLTICTWKLSTNQPNGLFVAMEFLDAVLNVGQGVFLLMVFIKDTKYIIAPISKWLRKVRHGVYSLNDPGDVMDVVIQQLCKQFRTYHRENCIKDLPRTIKKNDKIYEKCFTGTDFVDFLIKVGLANHRTAAENYGQRLFRGGELVSLDGAVQFHDNNAYLYNLN